MAGASCHTGQVYISPYVACELMGATVPILLSPRCSVGLVDVRDFMLLWSPLLPYPPPPLQSPPPCKSPPPGGWGGNGHLEITRRRRRQRKFFQGAERAEVDLHCDTMVQFCGATPPPPTGGETLTRERERPTERELETNRHCGRVVGASWPRCTDSQSTIKSHLEWY